MSQKFDNCCIDCIVSGMQVFNHSQALYVFAECSSMKETCYACLFISGQDLQQFTSKEISIL